MLARADAKYCSTKCRVYANRHRSRLPERMAGANQWTRADGKRPIQPDGRPASSTKPETWASFADVQQGAGDGFGVMLGSGLACWDLDHCLTGGRLAGWARDVLDATAPIWVEVSVSGDGLHVFVESPEGKGFKRAGIEFYSKARFIRVTGNEWRGDGEEEFARRRSGREAAGQYGF